VKTRGRDLNWDLGKDIKEVSTCPSLIVWGKRIPGLGEKKPAKRTFPRKIGRKRREQGLRSPHTRGGGVVEKLLGFANGVRGGQKSLNQNKGVKRGGPRGQSGRTKAKETSSKEKVSGPKKALQTARNDRCQSGIDQ